MPKQITEYFAILKNSLGRITGTDSRGKIYPCGEAVRRAIALLGSQAKKGGRLFFIGNGASASIASHQAVDFWKNTRIPALSFNDAALLTCISNDYGYAHVFEKPVELFMTPRDVLVAISSSGESQNIVNAALAARRRKSKILTLTGFRPSNRLKQLGDFNFHVPAAEYGFVEVSHHAILHCMQDMISKKRLNNQ